MKLPASLQQIPQIAALTQNANHVDVKTVEGNVSMQAFIAGMLEYQPGWMTFLYGVRWAFVRLLGMTQKGVPRSHKTPQKTIPMTPGQKASFFTIKAAEDERFWIAGTTESHLTAHLGVVVEALKDGQKRFYVITVVHYHRWTGPVYFNVIRPFHHLVVGSMMKGGLRRATSS